MISGFFLHFCHFFRYFIRQTIHTKHKMNTLSGLIKVTFRNMLPQIIQKKDQSQKGITQIKKHKYPLEGKYEPISPHIKASVIIPVKNPGEEFEKTLDGLMNQKKVSSVEIIIIDSGSSPQALQLCRDVDAKIISISPSSFNHGTTRNLGAQAASGDYIIFTVQDAIPPDEQWLFRLISTAVTHDLSAVSCRQLPRGDADLFSRFHLEMHYRLMQFTSDYYAHLGERKKPFEDSVLRRISHLDDVSCCYNREIFLQYLFKEVPLAEDLEIGMRLLRSGHRIGHRYSFGIIHSHVRSPDYWFVRSYDDAIVLAEIIQDTHVYSGEEIIEALQFYHAYSRWFSHLRDYSNQNPDQEAIPGFFDFLSIRKKDQVLSSTKKTLNDKIMEIVLHNFQLSEDVNAFTPLLTYYPFLFPLFYYIALKDEKPTIQEFADAAECYYSLHVGAFFGTIIQQRNEMDFLDEVKRLIQNSNGENEITSSHQEPKVRGVFTPT